MKARIRIDPDGCWRWTGALNGQGYGHVRVRDADWKVHVLIAQLFYGPMTVKQECDHLCRTRECCNPFHLEYVTHAENVRRGQGGQHNAVKTHCPQGHPYDEANTYVGKSGSRFCRACRRVRMRGHVRGGSTLGSVGTSNAWTSTS